MSLFRTFLFVPGSNYKWFNNLASYESDNVILDLEDSVPLVKKAKAREDVANSISGLAAQQQRVYVRINKGAFTYSQEDLSAVIHRDLEGIVLPKVNGPEDIEQISNQIAEIEKVRNLPIGSIKLIPTLETARSLYLAYDIALKDRVLAIAGLTAKDGDIQRSVNYQWTPQGLETLYYRSKVVLAARAANVIPIGGLWQNVHNLDGLKDHASFTKQLGYDGEMVLHPSNVHIVNEIYSPTEEEIDYYRGMIIEFEKAEESGVNAVIYDGNHIDAAHIKTARRMLNHAREINS